MAARLSPTYHRVDGIDGALSLPSGHRSCYTSYTFHNGLVLLVRTIHPMRTPLDDAAFLARSRHRVRVLETLAAGAADRRVIHEATDVPQPTLGRILGGFEAIGWTTHGGQEYALTPFGELVAREFLTLLKTIDTTQKLQEIAPWLPLAELEEEVGLSHFAEATVTMPTEITMPTESDSLAPVRRAAELIRDADSVRFVTRSATPLTTEAYRDAVVGGARFEAVLSADVVDVILADATMAAHLDRVLAAERGTVFRYEGPIPYIVGIGAAEGEPRAGIGAIDENGAPRGYVDTADEAVIAWVDSVVGRYRADAERLDSDDLVE